MSTGTVPPTVFVPAPAVSSALVSMGRHDPPVGGAYAHLFSVVAAAFGQRRKTLRQSLAGVAGSAAAAGAALRAAGVDPGTRAETLTLTEFAAVAEQLPCA